MKTPWRYARSEIRNRIGSKPSNLYQYLLSAAVRVCYVIDAKVFPKLITAHSLPTLSHSTNRK
jgi:hypothetical protein